jgi:membrane protein YdbS with pleckstrin-like domain
MNPKPKRYRPAPHAQYILQFLALPIALICIAAVRYVLTIVPAAIVNTICMLLLFLALLMIFILLPMWFRNTSYLLTEQEIISVTGIFIRREKHIRLRAVQCSTIIQLPFAQYTGMTFLPIYAYGGAMLLAFLKREDAAELCIRFSDLFYAPSQEESDAPRTPD